MAGPEQADHGRIVAALRDVNPALLPHRTDVLSQAASPWDPARRARLCASTATFPLHPPGSIGNRTEADRVAHPGMSGIHGSRAVDAEELVRQLRPAQG
jgi:hypothetical protein